MGIRVTEVTIEIGEQQQLEQAQGEDREYRLSFTEDGSPRDMTGATAVVMTVRDGNGALVFARNYSGFASGSSGGTPRFQVLQADTADEAVQPYNCDVFWTDASGYAEQLLVKSRFLVLLGVRDSSDPVTTPPAIPVVYGLNWLSYWSSTTGGYQINDAVLAQDSSLGATAISSFRATTAGVTHYPVSTTGVVATGWAYVAQHGGVGPTGMLVNIYGSTSLPSPTPLGVPSGYARIAVLDGQIIHTNGMSGWLTFDGSEV
jgi:hypothetical protein